MPRNSREGHFDEGSPLIPSIAEITQTTQSQYDQSHMYATVSQAFYEQSLIQFVMDEVHALLHIVFCRSRYLNTWYNPLYTILYVCFFVLTLPGALLHYTCLSCVPVRYREYAEERELRSQGIYAALGISFYSIPFAILTLLYN